MQADCQPKPILSTVSISKKSNYVQRSDQSLQETDSNMKSFSYLWRIRPSDGESDPQVDKPQILEFPIFFLAKDLHTPYSTLYLSTMYVLAKWTIANRFRQAP